MYKVFWIVSCDMSHWSGWKKCVEGWKVNIGATSSSDLNTIFRSNQQYESSNKSHAAHIVCVVERV